MKSDIEIARSIELKKIKQVAESVDRRKKSTVKIEYV